MSKPLHFKTNTLLKNLVGKDLINDDNIAIVELVKNSYDARSEEVVLKFEDFSIKAKTNAESSRIIIADKGVGMGEVDIEDKWLNIAYSEKKINPQINGSFLAGNKGIGRFSCDRLGSVLDMLTRNKGGDLIHIKINWQDFESEGDKDLTIQKVPVIFNVIDDTTANIIAGRDMPEAGTILVISKLRSSWDRNKLLDLKRSLEKFINPNQLFLQKKFQIDLDAEEFKSRDKGLEYHEQVNGNVKNLVFEKLRFNTTYIESSISDDGTLIKTNLFHDGEPVFRLQEKNTSYPSLKKIHSVIYYLNPYKKAYFKRQTGFRLVDFGTIFLFLNGFRIAPYGERGDDWLGLDVRKAQGISRYLGSRDIVGRIEVIDNNECFKPISSREGLKLTPEFAILKEKYFLDVLRRLERFVVDGLSWDSVPDAVRSELRNSDGLSWDNTSEQYLESWDKKRKRISLTIMSLMGMSKDKVDKFWFNPVLLEGLVEQKSQKLNALINDIEGFDGNVIDGDLKKSLKQIGKIVAEKEAEVKTAKQQVANLTVEAEEKTQIIKSLEKESNEFQAQTLFLKSVSTLDEKTLLGFHHQICLDSSIIDNYIGKTMKALRDKGDIKEALKHIEKISKANKKIMATAQYATKANFKSGSKKELTDLPTYFEQYLNNVTKEFVASGLKLFIENKVSEPFEIKAKRIELSILIDNIINNADKAHAKSLYVTMNLQSKNELVISFVDVGGKGLDASINPDNVFELGVTSTTGSGLGLYHTKQIIDSLDAEIDFIPRWNPKGVEIKMVFIK